MKKTIENKKINIKKEYAKKYLLKYIKELKVHFDLSENEIKDIMKEAYLKRNSFYLFFKRIENYFKEKI